MNARTDRTAAPLGTSPDEHLLWVRRIARKVCRNYHLRYRDDDPDFEDVAAAGFLKLLAKWPCFQPEPGCTDRIGAFRGYVHRTVKTACQREAERVINGGTYHCRRRDGREPVIARAFSTLEQHAESRVYEPATNDLPRHNRDRAPDAEPVAVAVRVGYVANRYFVA